MPDGCNHPYTHGQLTVRAHTWQQCVPSRNKLRTHCCHRAVDGCALVLRSGGSAARVSGPSCRVVRGGAWAGGLGSAKQLLRAEAAAGGGASTASNA